MMGIEFSVRPSDIDETSFPGEVPTALVERLAREKAEAVHEPEGDGHVLAGDTVVVLDGEILGKPRDRADAVTMLMRLRGREHQVASGLALRTPAGDVHSGVSVTDVQFADFERATAEAYAATDEPSDKAGAYGIQG